MLCSIFTFGTIEELVDVIFGHNILFVSFSEGICFIGSFIELTGAILPECIGIDSSQNVRHIAGQGCYCSHILGLSFMSAHILFAMHY